MKQWITCPLSDTSSEILEVYCTVVEFYTQSTKSITKLNIKNKLKGARLQ